MKHIALILTLGLAFFCASAGGAPGNFFIDKATNSPNSSEIRPAPGYVDAIVLVAGTQQTQNVPANARWVLFSSSCGIFYAKAGSATATVPVATSTTGAASELNPAAWDLRLQGITRISVISSSACILTLSFYL